MRDLEARLFPREQRQTMVSIIKPALESGGPRNLFR
jgi:hypothetical protein